VAAMSRTLQCYNGTAFLYALLTLS
jgi:hypothetical protein